MTGTKKNGTIESHEGYRGIGHAKRQVMLRRWKEEGKPRGLSLKAWARETGVGDAAFVWLESKKAVCS